MGREQSRVISRWRLAGFHSISTDDEFLVVVDNEPTSEAVDEQRERDKKHEAKPHRDTGVESNVDAFLRIQTSKHR